MARWNPFRGKRQNKSNSRSKSPFLRLQCRLELERFEPRWYPGDMLTALALSALGDVSLLFRERLLALFDRHPDAGLAHGVALRPAGAAIQLGEDAADLARISLLSAVFGGHAGGLRDDDAENPPTHTARSGGAPALGSAGASLELSWNDAGNLFGDPLANEWAASDTRRTANARPEGTSGGEQGASVGGDGAAPPAPWSSGGAMDGAPTPPRWTPEPAGGGLDGLAALPLDGGRGAGNPRPLVAGQVDPPPPPPPGTPPGPGDDPSAGAGPPSRVLPRTPQLQRRYGQLPLSFEPNRGQTDSRVQFLSRGRGYDLFFTPTEAVLTLHKPIGEGLRSRGVLRMQMVGANPLAQATGLERLPGISNYFLGSDPTKWRTNVPNYRKVAFANVYPGVDVVYYGTNQRQLEYDFVVRPGANPNVIQLAFPGATAPRLDARGHLVLPTLGGDVVQKAPVLYQLVNGRRQRVTGRHVMQGVDRVGFQVGAYDASRPLYIDPVLNYSSYLGGSGDDRGNGIAVDAAGNAYLTGQTSSLNFPTVNPFQPARGDFTDAFVAKVSADGSGLVYSSYLGGNGYDYGADIAVDAAGNAYLTGRTDSTNFPTANPFQPAYGGDFYDAFVAKVNADGSGLVYSSYLGGSDVDVGDGIAVDAAGNAYLTGYTGSENFPTANPFQPAYGGGLNDAFVAKVNAAGSALVYSSYLGGSAHDYGDGIAVDAAGNAYLMGETWSLNFPTANPFQPSCASVFDCQDAFVAKVNAAGSALVYSSYLGGSAFDVGTGIAVDAAGNAYLTGTTSSLNFPTASPFQPASGGLGLYDAFVAKVNADGSALVYSSYLGGSRADYGTGIAVDAAGNAYLTGETGGVNFPTANPFQPFPGGGGFIDAFVTKVSADGSALVYSSYLGGSGGDYGAGIAVDATGNAYVTGYTSSTDFPGTLPGSHGGGVDAFVAKIDSFPPALQRLNNPDASWLNAGLDAVAPNTGTLRIAQPLDHYKTQASALDGFFGLGVPPALVYNSDTVHVRPIGEVTPGWKASLGRPDTIDLTLNWNGTSFTTTTFATDAAQHPDGTTYLLAAQVPEADRVLNSGVYPWAFDATGNFGTGSVTWSYAELAYAAVTDNDDLDPDSFDKSPFGPGWGLGGLDRLVETPYGFLRVFGSGAASKLYVPTIAGTFLSPPDDFGTLAYDGNGVSYTSKELVKWYFEPAPAPLNGFQWQLKTVVDPHDLAVTFAYQTANARLLESVQMPDGGLTTFSYTGSPARLTRIDEPGDRYLTFTHSGASQNLTNLRNADGGLRTFTYGTAAHTLRRVTTDEWGPQRVTYGYDARGALTSVDRSANTTMTLAPSSLQGFGVPASPYPIARKADEAVARVTNALGNTTTMALDGLGRITRLQQPGQTTPENPPQDWVRDHAGQVKTYIDGRDARTTFTYDYLNKRGDLTKIQYPDTGVAEFTYHASFPKVIEAKDTRGNLTNYTYYEPSQDLHTVKNALDQVTTYTWDTANALLQQVEDPRTNVTAYEYYTDAANKRRLKVQINPDQGRTTYALYDNAGNPTRIENPRTYATIIASDARRRPLTVTDAKTGVAVFTYNATGQPTTRTDQESRIVTFTYDGRGFPLETIEPVQGTETRRTTTLYDKVGRLLSVQDPLLNLVSYGYDARDRRDLVIEAQGKNEQRQTTMLYDNADNVLSVTTGISSLGTYVHLQTTSYIYDPSNRRTHVIEAYGTGLVRITNTDYDTEGNVTKVTDPRAVITSYSYDALNRADRTDEAHGTGDQRSTTVLYDAAGNVLSVTTGIAPLTTYAHRVTTSYGYDAMNRRTVVIEDHGTGLLNRTTTTLYDKNGNATTMINARGVTSTVLYDELDRRIAMTEAAVLPVGMPALTHAAPLTCYAYDKVGNLLAVTDPRKVLASFTYDKLNRRTAVIAAAIELAVPPLPTLNHGSPITTTVYDKVGNVVAVQNPRGVVSSFSYDALYRRTAVIEAAFVPSSPPLPPLNHGSPITTFTYDAAGNVLKVENARQISATHLYDKLNRRVDTTEAVGTSETRRTTMLHDAGDNLLEFTTPRGVRTSYVYDRLNRRTEVREAWFVPTGIVGMVHVAPISTVVYDATNNVVKAVNPRQVAATYLYDNLNRRVAMTEAATDPGIIPELGHARPVTSYGYDALDNLITVTNPRSVTTIYSYDALDRRTEVRAAAADPGGLPALGHTRPITTIIYDAVGNVVQVKNPRDVSATYLYDALNRQVATTDAALVPDVTIPALGHTAPVTTLVYDIANNVLKVTNPRKVTNVFAYDALNRRAVTTEAASVDGGGLTALAYTTTSVYDPVGNVVGVSNARQVTTSFTYDALDRRKELIAAAIAPSGLPTLNHGSPITTTLYDKDGNLEEVIDPRNKRTTYLNDALNRRAVSVDPRGARVTVLYDAAGNVRSVKDPVNNFTTFTYDALNRARERTDPNTGLLPVYYNYYANSAPAEIIDRRGYARQFERDALDRLATEVWYQPGQVVPTFTFTYDSANNPLTAKGVGSGTYTFTYDGLNRPATQRGLFGAVLTFAYDAANNRIQVQDHFGGGLTASGFDAANRLQTRQFGDTAGTQLRMDISYSPTHQPVTFTRYRDLAGTNRVGDPSTLSYDALDRVVNLHHKSGAWSSSTTHVYDIGSLLRTETRNSTPVTFDYDDANQLTHDGVRAYAFDLNGNRTSQIAGYADAQVGNRLTQAAGWGSGGAAWATHLYDANGNLQKKSKGSSADTWQYAYDYRNQMTSATRSPVDGGYINLQATYVYDAFGLRIEKRVDPDGILELPAVTTRFAYDGDTIWADLNGDDTLKLRYLHGDAVDELFARIAPDGTAKWYLTDRLGSVRDILDNTAGTVDTNEYLEYDGYGAKKNTTGSPLLDRMRFTGREWDIETGLQYHRGRYYDPETGRWTSEDPIDFLAGDPNLYRYTRNGPTRATDPDGLQEQPPSYDPPSRASILTGTYGKPGPTPAQPEPIDTQRWAIIAAQHLLQQAQAENTSTRTGADTRTGAYMYAPSAEDMKRSAWWRQERERQQKWLREDVLFRTGVERARHNALPLRPLSDLQGLRDEILWAEKAERLAKMSFGERLVHFALEQLIWGLATGAVSNLMKVGTAARRLSSLEALAVIERNPQIVEGALVEGFQTSAGRIISSAERAQLAAALKNAMPQAMERVKAAVGSRSLAPVGPRPSLTEVPSLRGGAFNRWFNELNPAELQQVWNDPTLRATVEARLRAPGGMHEWLMVSRAPTFRGWGVTAEQIAEMRTAISQVRFRNPPGVHGGPGSTAAHNEILQIIDSSPNFATFRQRLQQWSNNRLEGGANALPPGLRPD